MGGRGYKNDVSGYLDGNRRTVEFKTLLMTGDGRIDILCDITSPKTPTAPIFSNSPDKIYALVGKRDKIKSIGFYDGRHMMVKTIHMDHKHDGYCPHVHVGDSYHHDTENVRRTTAEEGIVVEEVLRLWKEQGGK